MNTPCMDNTLFLQVVLVLQVLLHYEVDYVFLNQSDLPLLTTIYSHQFSFVQFRRVLFSNLPLASNISLLYGFENVKIRSVTCNECLNDEE